jgi:ectoine hydroxylase-related dioxygenase (phytanoyl-CoA dioxygenase family)
MDGAPDELDDELADEFEAEWRHAFRRVKTMTMRAGDVLFMSDRVLHCSGPNASDKVRRAWMPQFSSGPVLDAKGAPVAVARDMAFNIGYHRRETAWREKMDATREQRIAARREAEAKENAQPPAKEQPLRRQLIDELETVR